MIWCAYKDFKTKSTQCLPYKITSRKFLWWSLILTMNIIRAQKRRVQSAPQDPP